MASRNLLWIATASAAVALAYAATTWAQSGPTVISVNLYAPNPTGDLARPTGLTYSPSPYNELFIADTGHNEIKDCIVGGSCSVIAGNGTAGYVDGYVTEAEFNAPTGLSGGRRYEDLHGAIYSWIDLYVNDTMNHVLRRICSGPAPPNSYCNTNAGTVHTVAGTGQSGYVNGPATSAEFSFVAGTIGGSYIADSANNVLRYFDGANVNTFAGNGSPGLLNGPAAQSEFSAPTDLIQDYDNNTYVVDAGNQAIRKIDFSGNVTTLAGNGQIGYVDGPGSSAEFYLPTAAAWNPADGSIYVSDTLNNVIRRIDPSGSVTTYGGLQGQPGLVDGPLASAEFDLPTGIAVSGTTMFVADTMNGVIREVNMSTGQVTTAVH
ncbi:MAG: hypothetical protein ACRD1C_08245 [Terriglobales bacterium]